MEGRGKRLALLRGAARTHVEFDQQLLVTMVGEELNAVHRWRKLGVPSELPYSANGFIDQRGADGTLVHRKQLVRSEAVIPELELRVVQHVHARAIAIMPRLRRVNFDVARQLQLGPAAQRRAGPPPYSEAGPHGNVLVLASPAAAKIGTIWLNAFRCRRNNSV